MKAGFGKIDLLGRILIDDPFLSQIFEKPPQADQVTGPRAGTEPRFAQGNEVAQEDRRVNGRDVGDVPFFQIFTKANQIRAIGGDGFFAEAFLDGEEGQVLVHVMIITVKPDLKPGHRSNLQQRVKRGWIIEYIGTLITNNNLIFHADPSPSG
ncbi:hypothetical protein DESC_290250 [Desulfosarcina cetonica]|nr:hypothetical protein DESC_290250 [Desulfosarcina cetonica]